MDEIEALVIYATGMIEVTRKQTIVDILSGDKPGEPLRLYEEMLPHLKRVIPAAEKLKQDRPLVWALSLRANALAKTASAPGQPVSEAQRLKAYREAENCERKALVLVETPEFRLANPTFTDDHIADKHFNLACYLSAQDKFDDALEELASAVAMKSSLATDARSEVEGLEFRRMSASPTHLVRFDALTAAAPKPA